jgi:hypothetical protein
MPATILFNNFDLKKLSFNIPEENKMNPEITKYQLMSYPQYDTGEGSDLPTIQLPWMNLSTYGITSKLDKNGKLRLNNAGVPLSDRERGKLKIPLDLNDPASKELHAVLTAIDKKCEAEREQIFGDKKKASVYRYQPMVRQATVDIDAPEDAPPKPDYIVAKFDFDYATNNVKTKVFLNDEGTRTETNSLTLDDVQKHLRYKCTFRPIVSLFKLFSSRGAGADGKRSYGIGLKLKLVEVKPMKSMKEESETFFVDTDDEDDNEKKERTEIVNIMKKVEPTTTTKEDTKTKSKAKTK